MKGRVLLATVAPFHPAYQGDSARLAAVIGFLRARGWYVAVVHWDTLDHPDADLDMMSRQCDALTVWTAPRPRQAGPDPDAWCPDELAELVATESRRNAVDAVVVQFAFMSKCLARLEPNGRALKVIDADNVFSRRRDAFSQAGLEYDWFSTSPEHERRALQRADLVLAIQEAEARALAALVPDRPVLLVPHAQPAVALPQTSGSDLVFVGDRDPANEAGLREFVEVGLPAVRAAHPRARLVVAGRAGQAVGGADGVVALGVQPDLLPVYAQAAIVLNLAPVGTGLKIKTVEALCHGRCLLTTQAGAQGLEAYRENFVTVDAPGDATDAAIVLLGDRRRRHELERRALAFANTYFRPDIVLGRLESALRRTAPTPRGRTRVHSGIG